MKNWKYIEGAKTGNICSGNKKQDWDVGGNIDWDVGNFNGQWYVTKNGQKLVGPFMSMKEAERYLDGHKWELQNKYGNSKTGNTAHSDKVEVIKRLLHANWSVQEIYELLKKEGYEVDKNFIERMKTGNEDKTGAEEFFKQLSDDVKEREEKDDADIEKVGNALNWDENLVGKFVWVKDKGQEWKVYVMQDKGDKVYIRDDDGSQGWVSKTRITGKVGNSTWYEPRRMPFQPRSLQYAYEQAKKKGLSGQKLEAEMLRIAKTTPHDSAATESEMRKDVSEWVLSHGKPEDFVNNKQTGNSAPDDKFAYVMREFDEGKLKTPDGKVVTDPAQAKAIAYSESKKTENGLARARKAIK